MTKLAEKKCVPCSGGVPPLPAERVQELLGQLDGWRIEQEFHVTKEFKFPDFVSALRFVNRIGELAEEQGHHPALYLTWGYVRVEIWTHKIDGLTESDFILAAKIDEIPHG